MKCQNCGKNEVNFHYSSNINGCITESHLCSECAQKAGYDSRSMFNTRSLFDEFFSMPTVRGGFLPAFGFNMPQMFGMWPQMGILVQNNPLNAQSCNCAEHGNKAEGSCTEVDEECKKQREINVIREQMRKAAENEDYEKAAELRDKIKRMEK